MQEFVGNRHTIQEFVANDTGYRTTFNTTLQTLADADFSAAPLDGGTEILDDSITYAKLTAACVSSIESAISPGTTLDNDSYGLGRNQADSADINMWKINTSDLLEHGANLEEARLGHQKKVGGTTSGAADHDWMYTNSSDQLEFLSDSYTQSLIAKTDSTYTIGTASKAYSEAHVDALYVGGGDSVSIIEYDTDYTWTVSGGSVAGAGTYTSQKGGYLKIGNVCHIWGRITWSAHTGSGTTTLDLPFTAGAFGGFNIKVYADSDGTDGINTTTSSIHGHNIQISPSTSSAGLAMKYNNGEFTCVLANTSTISFNGTYQTA